ncbi:MAG: serine/threonine-protein kinase, partial [Candidatus Eisenbacteria bacterium]
LKVVLDADPEFHACLQAEFRVLRSLRHPHLVEVHEFGFLHKPALPYLVMDYVPGQDLLRATETMEDIARARVLCHLAGVLHHLHSRGFLHRDLKPENVRIHEKDGTPRLLDLGLARPIGETEEIHAGTLEYVAPEVLLRHPASIASDLYSLGVLLYRVFSGHFPIDAADADALSEEIVRTQPRPLGTVRPDLPAAVVERWTGSS